MATTLSGTTEPNAPTAADALLAQESSQRLTKALEAKSKNVGLRVELEGGVEENVSLPPIVVGLLEQILSEVARGNAVTLLTAHTELTPQQAADLLNVSRPYLVDLLENGTIPSSKVGDQRRVSFHDVMSYKKATDQARLKALDELSAIDQELGLGY